MNIQVYWLGLALLSWTIGPNCRADDSLSALMQGMRSKTAVRIAYQETRTLELMEQPWHGSGFMYFQPPDLMIKEQLQPERLLMAVKGEHMFYFDPTGNIRHQGVLADDNPLALNIGVLRALINADEALLRRLYRIEFTRAGQGWSMSLRSGQDIDSGFNIIISGLTQQQADTIKVKQADGDLSEFSLQPGTTGNIIESTVKRLYRELQGE